MTYHYRPHPKGGYPIPGLDMGGIPHPGSGQDGFPIPGLDGRYPISRIGYSPRPGMGPKTGWGTPHPRQDGVPPPSRPGTGGYLGYPPSRPGMGGTPCPRLDGVTPPVQTWDGGYPSSIQTWDGGYPGVPPHPRLDGVPPCPRLDEVPPLSKTRWGTPPFLQQSEHLLRGGLCASCVHAGGLSCYYICTQKRKRASEGSTLALKPREDVIRSPKEGYQ